MTINDSSTGRRRPRSVTRRGRWTYGDHRGLDPGWRLAGTDLVLDYDPYDTGGLCRGVYSLWEAGQQGHRIDHYLDGSMTWVEEQPAAHLTVGLTAELTSGPGVRSVLRRRRVKVLDPLTQTVTALVDGGFIGSVADVVDCAVATLTQPQS